MQTEGTSITIDPTFWVAFFGFLTAAVSGFFAYKTSKKADAIGEKVDGAATATQTEITALRTEIARLNEDRVARADAAPAPDGEAAPATVGAVTATKAPIPVVIEDTKKTVPVEVIVKQVP